MDNEARLAQRERLIKVKDAIQSINASLLESASLEQLFGLILRSVLPAIEHANVACVLALGDDGKLRIVASIGYAAEDIAGFRVRLEDTFQWKKSHGRLSDTLIINDLPGFMRELGIPSDIPSDSEGQSIKSTMSTPLIVEGEFIGLLNLDSRNDNVFDEIDRTLVEVIRSQVPIAIRMFKSFERIRELLSEKELLLREVHHRIKNNMSTVASLLALRASATSEPLASSILDDASRQVKSMTTLYDRLYATQYSGRISARSLLQPLVADIVASFKNDMPLEVAIRIDDFELEERQLQPLCIIINEILTNAMKYAFKGRNAGRIEVSASEEAGSVRVRILDDGIGLPSSVDLGKSDGFGLMLVRSLAEQLGASARLERAGGTLFSLELPDGSRP